MKKRGLTRKAALVVNKASLSGTRIETANPLPCKPIPPGDEAAFRALIESREDAPSNSFLEFEPAMNSPYWPPLDGEEYEEPLRFGPTGMCPICNNARHRELDAFFLRTMDNPERWSEYPWPNTLIFEHVVKHIGLIYASAALAPGAPNAVKDDSPSLVARKIARAIAHERSRRAYVDREEALDDKYGNVEYYNPIGLPSEPVTHEPSPSCRGRPDGAKAKDWYAYDGANEIGPLRPWRVTRVENEIEHRKADAIVLLDDMAMVRQMGLRVYSDIMDGDEPVVGVNKSGEPIYGQRNHSGAIAAARLVKDVAMDLAKLALIAKRQGEESGNRRVLSDTMRRMLSDLGIEDDVVPMKAEVIDGEEALIP